MKKIIGIVLSALLIVAAFASVDTAEARGGRNTAAALGLLGGVALGAAIANSDRRDYNCDQWGNCYPRRHYRAGPPRGLVWNEDKGCYVRRSNYWGRCQAY